MLHTRAIQHTAVSGKLMYYLRIWKDNENDSVLVNIGKGTYNKVVKLGGPIYGEFEIEGGGDNNEMDNNNKEG